MQDLGQINPNKMIYKIDFRCQVLHNLYNEYYIVLKVISVEKNLNEYIRRLVELDSKAVELKKERDAELETLAVSSRNGLKSLDAVLEEAAKAAKGKHDEIIEAARMQAKEMDEAAKLKISELQNSFSGFKEEAARDIWKQLLDIER